MKLESLVGKRQRGGYMDENRFHGAIMTGSLGMEELIIPPCAYAVFPNVVDAWKRLYSEWLPASGYELANQPCIEHFLRPGNKIKHELWVPIVEK